MTDYVKAILASLTYKNYRKGDLGIAGYKVLQARHKSTGRRPYGRPKKRGNSFTSSKPY
jgi:hypothetical protein